MVTRRPVAPVIYLFVNESKLLCLIERVMALDGTEWTDAGKR